MKYYMVFDVESVGLHGEGFAVGWVVVDQTGQEIDRGYAISPQEEARGSEDDRQWVLANVPEMKPGACGIDAIMGPRSVRFEFWNRWRTWSKRGATLWADCVWLVESNFLSQCVADFPEVRTSEAPYPCYDVMTLRLAAGFDPHETSDRLPNELPVHDPLADARQSARLLIDALNKLLTSP